MVAVTPEDCVMPSGSHVSLCGWGEVCLTLALQLLVQKRGQDIVRVLIDGAKGTVTQETTQETVRDLSTPRVSSKA